MSTIETKVPVAIYFFIGLLTVTYAIGAIVVGPSMYSDQGEGFRILEAMKAGARFNNQAVPDPANIARDINGFMGWWSPAQYLVPGVFEWLGLPLGQAITLVTILCSISALVGLHFLYRSFGFSPLCTAVAVALVACTRSFALPFGIYTGGDIILFALVPWFTLLVWRVRRLSPQGAIWVFVGMAALTFAKLSGLVFCVALVLAVVAVDWLSGRPGRWGRAILAAAPLGSFALAFQLLWASQGTTPASGHALAPMRLFTHSIFAFTASFTSVFSLGDLAGYILLRPGREILQSFEPFYFVAALPALALAAFAGRQLWRTHNDYLRFAAAVLALYTALMTAIWVGGSDVSVEDRHFRPIGVILAVGIVHAVLHARRMLVVAAVIAVLPVVMYGVSSYFVRINHSIAQAKGDSGIRHQILSKSALAFIQTDLNRQTGGNSVVLVPSPEIALELRGHRVISSQIDFGEKDELAQRIYRGRVDRLGVLVQTRLVDNGKAAIVLAAFKDYPKEGWAVKSLGDYTYFSQGRPQ